MWDHATISSICGLNCSYGYSLTVVCNWSLQFPLVSTVSTGLQSAVVTGSHRLDIVVFLVSAASMLWSETAEMKIDQYRDTVGLHNNRDDV